VPVRARIYTVGGLSAHADQAELLHWLRGFRTPPRHTFVMHGEAGASATFAALLHTELGWSGVTVPRAGTCVSL
jgi:metallo-beta-lactamase family protein